MTSRPKQFFDGLDESERPVPLDAQLKSVEIEKSGRRTMPFQQIKKERELNEGHPAALIEKIISSNKKRIPHIQEMIEALIDEWGGPRDLAAAFHDTYHHAKAGSVIRARLLENLIALMKMNSQMYEADTDLEGVSEKDLHAFIRSLGREAINGEEAVTNPDGE